MTVSADRRHRFWSPADIASHIGENGAPCATQPSAQPNFAMMLILAQRRHAILWRQRAADDPSALTEKEVLT
jgi:hypothetical protein